MMRKTIVMLLCLLLFACQPTPEKDAVKQKDTNVLIDAVRNENGEQNGGEAAKEQLPERMQYDFTTSRGNVHIHADVPIEVLSETGAFPVLRVEHRYLTDDERLTVAKRLLSSDTLYVWEYHETRASLAVQIAEYMRELTPEEKAEWMEETNSTEEEYEEMLLRRKALVEAYQKRYNELPEDDIPVPLTSWDGSVPMYSEYDFAGNRVTVVPNASDSGPLWNLNSVEFSANGGNSPMTFSTLQRDGADTTNVFFFNQPEKPGTERIARNDYDKPHEGARITPNEAIRTVTAIFDGIGTFAAADVYWANNAETDGEDKDGVTPKNMREVYLIHLSSVYGGAYMPYCQATAFDATDNASDYVIPWNYETLMAAVDGEGNLLSLVWDAPLKVTETISESAKLLPFEEITEIIEAQLGRMFVLNSEIDITNVQLGLFRIREQNNLESGLLVPVWFLLGEYRPKDEQSGTASVVSSYNNLNPLLIINAIDGSIIDPMKGY